MDRDAVRRMKELQKQNARLKRLVAEKELDILIFKEVAKGEFRARRGGAGRSSTRRR